MPFGKLLLVFVLVSIVFFAIDMIWLGWLGRNLYQKYMGHLLSPNVNWTAAFIFYGLFICGILFFCVFPAVDKGSVLAALGYGAFFGLITYSTYDLTNLATLKDWPVQIVFIDIPWGAFLCASVSVAGFYIVNWLQ